MLLNSFARAAQHISGACEAIKIEKRLKSLIPFFISTVQFHSLPPDIDGFNEKINQAHGVPALQWKTATRLVYQVMMLF